MSGRERESLAMRAKGEARIVIRLHDFESDDERDSRAARLRIRRDDEDATPGCPCCLKTNKTLAVVGWALFWVGIAVLAAGVLVFVPG